jgi:hypothetical protein
VALKCNYKQLWRVKRVFRDEKSLLDTRQIFHQKDWTVRDHVFCSFLALVLRKELDQRLVRAGHRFEWAEIKQNLKVLQSVTTEENGRQLAIRSQSKGVCGKIFQAVGAGMSPTIRDVEPIPEKQDGSANKICSTFNRNSSPPKKRYNQHQFSKCENLAGPKPGNQKVGNWGKTGVYGTVYNALSFFTIASMYSTISVSRAVSSPLAILSLTHF